MTVCYLTSQKVVLSINFCSLSLCLFLTHLPQFLNNLYGLGWFIHDHSVLWMCVHMRVCLCVCACSGQATRVWQQASTVTGDTLEIVTGCQLYTIIWISLSHSLLLTMLLIYLHIYLFILLLHLYSLHSHSTCVFFSFHSSTLCFLSGSQQDLNNWMFLILCFFVYFFLSQSVDESFYLCSGLSHLFFNLNFTHYLVSLLWRQFPLVWPIWSIQPGSAGADL